MPLLPLPLPSVSGVFAISEAQVDTFFDVFADCKFPRDRVVVSPNGIDTEVFRHQDVTRAAVLSSFKTTPYPDSPRPAVQVPAQFDHVVLFVGKFADWKRLDAMLRAHKVYHEALAAQGKSVCLLIVGSGSDEAKKEYQDMAHALQLQDCYFIGPQNHPTLANLYSISDVGVFPSKNEPMGLVFIECMACGTPVIGADSGGPRDFVDSQVGVLVPETDDAQAFSDGLAAAVTMSLREDWKASKGKACVARANEKYTLKRQCDNLLESAKGFPIRKQLD